MQYGADPWHPAAGQGAHAAGLWHLPPGIRRLHPVCWQQEVLLSLSPHVRTHRWLPHVLCR